VAKNLVRHQNIVKAKVTYVLLSLFLAACGKHYAILPNQIAGTWTNETSDIMTIGSDGSFSTKSLSTPSRRLYEGTMKVTNDVLISTITNVIGEAVGLKVGSVVSFKLIRLDEHKLVYKVADRTYSFSR